MRLLFSVAAFLLLGLSPLALRAQIPPLGPEFQVNTYTTGPQVTLNMASARNGTFVVVWESKQDGAGYGIFGQRFDSLGSPAGSEFPVNSYTTGGQHFPAIAVRSTGDFVVVWDSPQDGSGYGIFGQRFDAASAKVGSEFPVNTYTTGLQASPSVALDAAGNFVVVWERYGSGYDVRGQRFDSSGAKVGLEFQVSSHTENETTRNAVAMTPTGEFIVVWDAARTTGTGRGVVGQRFNSSGVPVGAEFAVDSDTSGTSFDAAIDVDARGNFVVVWSGQDGSGYGVFGQRFNASAEKVGPVFPVNSETAQNELTGSVSIERDGGFVVSWEGPDAAGNGAFAQRFDRTGARLGSEISLNTYTTSDQNVPRISSDGGGLVAVWQSLGEDGDDWGVFGRRQILGPGRLTVDFQGDGVLEPGEVAIVAPSWSNDTHAAIELTGSVSDSGFRGPPGPTYSLIDGSANYGSMPSNSFADCNDGNPNPCYAVQVSGTRPATHWDATLEEDLSVGGSQLWTLHVGDSFTDVPRSEPFYKKIETLLHNGITAGCTATTYCPGTVVSRDQMAIFIAKGIAGSGEYVPTTGVANAEAYNCLAGGHSLFSDVAPSDPACRHIHYLAAQNVTLGCTGTQYCPGQTVTRDAMASFIAKAIVAPAGGAGVPISGSGMSGSYSCNPALPNIHFSDVPVTSPFCKHIHYLWANGIVDGCTATKYCPSSPVARDAMAKFIANGFGLQLYGP